MLAYRLTAYAARSVDITEATVLTPFTNAPHADAFRVATVQGLAGYKPYLGMPRGRKGRLSAINASTDTGTLTLRLEDFRTGSSNLQRWVTAFLGASNGLLRIKGRKVYIEESTDWDPVALTGTWSAFFTGRISNLTGSGRLGFDLEAKDMSTSLKADVFSSYPHPSATYAFLSSLIPLGLTQPFGDTRNIQAGLTCTTGTATGLAGESVGTLTPATAEKPGRRSLNKVAYGLHDYDWLARVVDASGNVGYFDRGRVTDSKAYNNWVGVGQRYVRGFQFGRTPLPGSTMGSFPGDGTSVTVTFTSRVPAAQKAVPVMVNDVHPVQFLKDLLLGYFSALKADGSPAYPVTLNAASFAALIADTSFAPGRWAIPEKAERQAFIETQICKPWRIGYYFNEAGEFVVVDLRFTSSVSTVATLSSSDLVAGSQAPQWVTGQEAISRVDIQHYVDAQPPLPVNVDDWRESQADMPAFAEPQKNYALGLSVTEASLDAEGKPVTIDWQGMRSYALVSDTGTLNIPGLPVGPINLPFLEKVSQIVSEAAKLEAQLLQLFGPGAQYLSASFVRNANSNPVKLGTYALLTLQETPDPSINERGGTRIGLCVERSEDGPAVTLRFLDCGSNATAPTPSISVAANTSNPGSAADVTVTLANLLGVTLPAMVEIISTPPGTASRPAVADPAWRAVRVLEASGSFTVTALPSGSRVWFRAHSLSYASGGRVIPSANVYPSAQYIDTAALTAPSSLTATGVTKNAATLTWTPGSSAYEVEVLVRAGASAPTGLAGESVTRMNGSSTTYDLLGLSGPGVVYTAGVRHIDRYGGFSTMATVTFTTTSSNTVSPRPAGIDLVPA